MEATNVCGGMRTGIRAAHFLCGTEYKNAFVHACFSTNSLGDMPKCLRNTVEK